MDDTLTQEQIDAVFDWCGPRIRDLVKSEFGLNSSILDVGAGWGKYRYLLSEYPNMDACEIWLPTILDANLTSKYRQVFNNDICDLALESLHYDVIIMGDVLEHIPRPQAEEVVSRLSNMCSQLHVVVPFEYEQDEVEGNPYQVHEQSDLTPKLMNTLYPELKLVDVEVREGKPFKGLYIKRGGHK